MTRFEQFDAAHGDKVVAIHVNFDGSRILTASVDHRIKVWTRDSQTGELNLLDIFKAHDGDVKDAKWFHPTTGSHIASCGNDRILRIYHEDRSAAPRSGRMFQPIAQISSKSSVPFVSLDIKNVANVYTYLAVIDRQGLVTVFVPESPDKFTEWRRSAQFSVCPPPGNGEETSFKVRFDPNLSSLAYYNGLTDERNSLGLVVTAMDQIKVYHAVNSGAAGGSTEFIEVASITLAPKVLVRDVQWAPFNVRGIDLIATASRNGDVTILEMSHTSNPESTNNGNNGNSSNNGNTTNDFPRQSSSRPAPQSSLTTAIAGRSSTPASSRPASFPASKVLPYSTHLKVATTITHAHEDGWSLAWDPAGQVLMSNGSEGKTSMWKKSITEGKWKEFSSIDFEIKEDGEDEEWAT